MSDATPPNLAYSALKALKNFMRLECIHNLRLLPELISTPRYDIFSTTGNITPQTKTGLKSALNRCPIKYVTSTAVPTTRLHLDLRLSCMYVWWCCVAADRRELWSARQEQCQSSAVTRSPGTCALLAREYFSRLAVKHANVCIRVCKQYTIAITCLVLSGDKTVLLFP